MFGEDYEEFLPMEVIAEHDNHSVFIYNLHNTFIFGIAVEKAKTYCGRGVAQQAMRFMAEELKSIASMQEDG